MVYCTAGLIEFNYIFYIAQDTANFSESDNCSIFNNEIIGSNSENGAIYVYDSSNIIIGCNYVHDTTAANGIEIYTNYGDILVADNLIVNNRWKIKSQHHEYSGNGILGYKPVWTGYTLTISHNTISNNVVSPDSLYHSGDINFGNGIGLNTTVLSSSVDFDGNVDIVNNIIAFNSGWGVITKLYSGYNGPTYCDVDFNDIYGNIGGITAGTCIIGANNLYLDPFFNADYTLQPGSPCLNAANDLENMGVLFNNCGCTSPPGKQLKESAKAALDSLLPTGDNKIDKEIEKSVEHLEKSLKEDLWLDDIHLVCKKGDKVFKEEKEAVKKLMHLMEKKDITLDLFTAFQDVINMLLVTDQKLAQTAIDEAVSGKEKELEMPKRK